MGVFRRGRQLSNSSGVREDPRSAVKGRFTALIAKSFSFPSQRDGFPVLGLFSLLALRSAFRSSRHSRHLIYSYIFLNPLTVCEAYVRVKLLTFGWRHEDNELRRR